MSSPEQTAQPADAVVAVLGLVAACGVTTLGWLADDSTHAPDARTRIELARLAAARLCGHDELERIAREHGGGLSAAAAPHLAVFRGITERTRPADWWERLLRTAVAGGMLHDLADLLTDQLPGIVRAGLPSPRGREEHLDLVIAVTAPVTAGHPSLAARQALWGRRVAGEVLGAVAPALAQVGADLEVPQVLGTLSSGHARRMDRLGLAA